MSEVIVIGGGHAGVEAALACARCGKQTILYTIKKDMIASMPCNPSIGGPAKGIVVREIDALGGEMGKAADATALQFKMLNTTKGPGVQCLRVQSDKLEYRRYMRERLEQQENLEIREMMVTRLLAQDHRIIGVEQEDGTIVHAKIVILTTGTFMSATVLVGHEATESGPEGQKTNATLSQSLRDMGLCTFRLKTGTPARIKTDSIDFSQAEIQPGTKEWVCFSYTTKQIRPYEQQLPCYLIYTTAKTHEIIRQNLERSAMYSGLVKGVGPRYCPSIEDKLVRFADKPRHQLFLEPESESLDTTYVQGFSTSMPHDVQEAMLRSLPGLANCVISRYAYAIEYDAIDPLQMKASLENKVIENLFTAGQINGTSGYEEAAGQGLLAGINAVKKLEGKAPLILRRDEAYLGVLIDDLVTKGTNEPYRLLTSRAEYRLLLRHDNADERLCTYGYEAGLISAERYQTFLMMQKEKEAVKEALEQIRFTPHDPINAYLSQCGFEPLKETITAAELLKRPQVSFAGILPYISLDVSKDVAKRVEIEIKYAGYIAKAKRDAENLRRMEARRLPDDLDYEAMEHLSLEAKQKLQQIRPETMGQASRISGVNPSDIAVLAIYLESRK